MSAVLAIAWAELKRFAADRSNIFFVFIFPLALVFVLGSQFSGGGSSGTVALVGDDSSLHTALVEQFDAAELEVKTTDEDEMRRLVARGGADVGVVIPEDAVTAFDSGADPELELVSGSQGNALAVSEVVRSAATAATLRVGQQVALASTGADAAQVSAALERAESALPPTTISVRDTSGLAQAFRGLGTFDLGASSQLLLFTFLTTLSAGSALIAARRNGVIKRIMAAPVTATQTVAGQGLGRLVVALLQALYIVLATALLFQVSWGDPLAVAVLLLAFSLVATGVAMAIGVLVDNEGLAIGVAVGAGLVLGAIGGAMIPLEIFPDTMRRIAHVTPHAWAYDAMAEIQRHGGGVLDILPQLGVLLAMAAVMLALGAWLLRRSLARAM